MKNAVRDKARRTDTDHRRSEDFRLNVQRIHEQIVKCRARHWEVITSSEETLLGDAMSALAAVNAGRLGGVL